MITYLYDCYTVLNKVYKDKTFIKQAISDTFISERSKSLTVKTCYGVLDRDEELSYYIKILAPKQPKLSVKTVLKISMYAVKYLGKAPYAVTKNAVELVKKLGKGGTAGFINAFLRRFSTEKIDLPEDETLRASVEFSYPLFAVKELKEYFGIDRTRAVLAATLDERNKKTCVSFFDGDGEKYLKEAGYNFEATPFKGVFFAENFLRNEDYDKGVYTFQAIGSVAICENVLPAETLLDCCAAPGGKSIRLSYKCKKVVSFDLYPHRVELIKSYLNRMRRVNVFPEVKDAAVFYPELEEKFDAVLVDAPCSGLGVAGDNPDIKLNRTKEDVDELNAMQISILKTAARYVKKGGYLYYSTCSILPRENIAIIDKFMSDINGFEIVNCDSPLPHEDIKGTILYLPDISLGAGFYFAKLKRIN